jgi:uncharacterized protein (DUF952 family)
MRPSRQSQENEGLTTNSAVIISSDVEITVKANHLCSIQTRAIAQNLVFEFDRPKELLPMLYQQLMMDSDVIE